MSHTMLFMFDTCCSDTISHKIAGDTDTQNVQHSWRGQIKRAVDVPQPYWVRQCDTTTGILGITKHTAF